MYDARKVRLERLPNEPRIITQTSPTWVQKAEG
jgi:hypothetical protein